MKICLVAAPLTARSGVYRTTHELIAEARQRGLDWEAVVGVTAAAGGRGDPAPGIEEFEAEAAGPQGVLALRRKLTQTPAVREADYVISMIPQSDMALALTKLSWVAFIRGLPWPALGEARTSKRIVWRWLERRALARADLIWATTERLRTDVGKLSQPIELVTAGVAEQPAPLVSADAQRVVWAARFDEDKNPHLFFEALRDSELRGYMYGSGHLEQLLRDAAPENVSVVGWAPSSELWGGATAFLGTSHREAFGRSAVEAAMAGVPVILSDAFGVADELYRDPVLRKSFVLPVNDVEAWKQALQRIASDSALRARVIEHLRESASRLTIAASVEAILARLEDRSVRVA